MTNTDITAYLKDIELAADHAAVQNLTHTALQALGIDRFYYVFVPPHTLFDESKMVFFQRGYESIPGFCRDYEAYLKTEEAISFFSFHRSPETRAHYGIRPTPDPRLNNLMALIHKYKNHLNLERAMNVPVYGPHSHYGYYQMRTSTARLEREQMRIVELFCQAAHLRTIELCMQNTTAKPIKLSRREKDVLVELLKGKKNSQIALDLAISKHTVDAYMRRIFVKLDVNDRIRASVKVMKLHLLSDNNLYDHEDDCDAA